MLDEVGVGRSRVVQDLENEVVVVGVIVCTEVKESNVVLFGFFGCLLFVERENMNGCLL